MNKIKAILKKIIHPRFSLLVFFVVLTTVLLAFVLNGRSQRWYSYPVFLFSAYTLAVLCIWIIKCIPYFKGYIKKTKNRFTFTRKYFSDIEYKTKATLFISLTINILYGLFKFVLGIVYQSLWFDVLAIYYISLALIRFALLTSKKEDSIAQLNSYRKCGFLLFLVNMTLTGVAVLIVNRNEGFHYYGYLIYVMAIYAFYKVIVAIKGMIQYRKYHQPILSATKVVNLSAALVSMLALETAMLEQFDNSQNPEAFRKIMTSATSIAVCFVIFFMALYMIIHSTQVIKKTSDKKGWPGQHS